MTTTEESEVYPLYRFEEEMASRTIARAGRAYIARRSLHIFRRKKMRHVKSTSRGERLGSQARTREFN